MQFEAPLLISNPLTLLSLIKALLALSCLPGHVLVAGCGNGAIALLDLLVPIRTWMAPYYRDLLRHLDR
jgi:hypothetical protein